ncbi:MAG: hypothetical protein JWQ25_1592, partial [Daejeonella sp.]|nr:hypothetical protein [Daejeonella sp.]
SKVIDERKPIFNVFKEDHIKNGSYIIVAGTVKLDEYDFKELTNYMQKGNNVFIASYYLSQYLNDTLKISINSALASTTKLRFTNKNIDTKLYSFDRGIGDQFFSKYDTAKATILGVNQDKKPVFLKYKFGAGALYLMPSPKLLSNYAILKPSGADYAAKALSHLKIGGDIIWDDYASLGRDEEASLFRVFFYHHDLRNAYYIALFSLLAFVLFEMKRRQRIIPVISPLKNTTVEFVELIGKVYYQQRDHADIGKKKINYLLEYIRTNHNIRTNIIDKEFNNTLIAKTGFDAAFIGELLMNVNFCLSSTKLSDQQLIDLNKIIEEFYKKSR